MSDFELIDGESLIEHLKNHLLPKPVVEMRMPDGTIALIGGDPAEVIVRTIFARVSVGIYSVRWQGPGTPVIRPKWLASLNCRRLPASKMIAALHTLINTACDLRRSKYRKCERCGQDNPPERMHDKAMCQACAQRYLGIVY